MYAKLPIENVEPNVFWLQVQGWADVRPAKWIDVGHKVTGSKHNTDYFFKLAAAPFPDRRVTQ